MVTAWIGDTHVLALTAPASRFYPGQTLQKSFGSDDKSRSLMCINIRTLKIL